MIRSWWRAFWQSDEIILLLGTLLSFGVPLWFWNKTLTLDWEYFNSLSLVVKSQILHYHRFPLHDPWVDGGTDMIINPQLRVFSPMGLLDILLSPPHANLVSLIIYGFLGALGMFRVISKLGISKRVAFTGAFLFINSNWFSLHYSEGHIPFGPIQLIPWAFYFTMSFSQPKAFAGFGVLIAFLAVSGGSHALVFSLLIVLSSFAFGFGDRKIFRRSTWVSYWRHYGAVALTCSLVLAARYWSIVSAFSNRQPKLYHINIPLRGLKKMFFDPWVSLVDQPVYTQDLRFHEFGCYLGVFSVVILLLYGLDSVRRKDRKVLNLALLCGFWLWIGICVPTYSPWGLIEQIPVINSVRIPMRALIVMVFFFVLLLAHALNSLLNQKPKIQVVLIILLLIESFVAKNYPFYKEYLRAGHAWPEGEITSTTIFETVPFGDKPSHYLKGNLGARSTYEPVYLDTAVRVKGAPDYRGEVWLEDSAAGDWVNLDKYLPGEIHLTYHVEGQKSARVRVNTNTLFGWKGADSLGREIPLDSTADLLSAELPTGDGKVIFTYHPRYIVPSLLLGILALFSGLFSWRRLNWLD